MSDPGKKKEDYQEPRSFDVTEDDLDDVSAGVTAFRASCVGGSDFEENHCLIGGSARGDCGTGLQASLCRSGGSPSEDCVSGRVR